MKFIHVEDYFDPTAGYQINELLFASKEFDDEVFLITSTDMTPFHKTVDKAKDLEFEKATGVKIIRLKPIIKLSSRLILKTLMKTIEEIDPDVVYMHGIGDFKDLQLWKRKRKYKIIRDCHMSWVASKNKFRNVYYKTYNVLFANIINATNKYEVIYALGDEEYEYLIKLGIKKHKINYLRHGYNESIMYYDKLEREYIRQKYGFNDDDIVVSYIGKFNDSKRPDLIIDIFEKLDYDFINLNKVNLMLIGPQHVQYMESFNHKLAKIRNRINIVIDDSKPFNELRKYYSASDICIFPKETSLSSIHAQVCGCPVIMEKHKSNAERVVNNNNLYSIDDILGASIILKRIVCNAEYIKDKNINYIDSLSDREYKKQILKLKSIASNNSKD